MIEKVGHSFASWMMSRKYGQYVSKPWQSNYFSNIHDIAQSNAFISECNGTSVVSFLEHLKARYVLLKRRTILNLGWMCLLPWSINLTTGMSWWLDHCLVCLSWLNFCLRWSKLDFIPCQKSTFSHLKNIWSFRFGLTEPEVGHHYPNNEVHGPSSRIMNTTKVKNISAPC